MSLIQTQPGICIVGYCFFVWPNTGQLFAPPNLWFLHMMDTEIKKLVTPRICYFQISTRSIAKPPAVLPYGAWLFSGLRTLPLRSCNSPAAFQTLGCHFDNVCFGLQRAYVCDSMIFEGDFKTSLAPVAKPFWPRKWRAQSNIFRLLVFLHSCPMTTAGNLFYTT